MKRIAICEDNNLQRELLVEMVQEYFRRIYQRVEIEEYGRGDVLVADMEDGDLHVAAIFLDIYMPGMNGIETARRLRALGYDAEIVFLTASSEHALESYDVRAAGYLIKPINMERLETVLRQLFWADRDRRIEIKCGRQYRYPNIRDIVYIESMGHKATLHMADGAEIETAEKISSLCDRIDDLHFLQCHQSYLVNMTYIVDFADDGSTLLLRAESGGVAGADQRAPADRDHPAIPPILPQGAAMNLLRCTF